MTIDLLLRSHDALPVAFNDLRRKLEAHGWTLARISGSHHIFTKPGTLPLSIPVHHGKVKAVYARKVDKACSQNG